jgi:hypothetical protein
MGTSLVEVLAPFLGPDLRMFDRQEPAFFRTLSTKPAVEAIDVRVLNRFSGTFLLVDPADGLVVDPPSVPATRHVPSTIPGADPDRRRVPQPDPGLPAVPFPASVVRRRPADLRQFTGRPTHAGRINTFDQPALPRGPRSHLEITSCKMCLPCVRSATIFRCFPLRGCRVQ